jgi:collagen type IV alpha-3-binding protein
LNNDPDDDEKDGWKEFHSEGKMRMFRRDEATPDGRIIDPLRLFHTIDKVSAYECQHYFWDTKYRLEWEHTIEKFKILEVLDGTTIVLLQDHKRVWPAAKRDAVYLSSMQCLSDFKSDDPCYLDTWIVTNFSVEHDQASYNPSDNNVRVFIDVCMMCQTYKKDASKSENDRENIFTKVTYISQVDPGGWLPPAALRKVYKKEYPRFLRNFSKYVNDKTKGNKNVLYEHKYE